MAERMLPNPTNKEDPVEEQQESLKGQIHRRKSEILWNLRRLARSANEEEFKAYLTEHCGVLPGTLRYKTAMSAFWTAVREFELQKRGR